MNDGGPVFAQCGWKSEQQGISLRDWYAGMALQGELACQGEDTGGEWQEEKFNSLAHRCYQLADAMLVERQKQK